jgi:hypothetical protein
MQAPSSIIARSKTSVDTNPILKASRLGAWCGRVYNATMDFDMTELFTTAG